MSHYDTVDDVRAAVRKEKRGMTLLMVFAGESFVRVVNYPVIVECWKHKKYGRHRRRWESTFTPAERRTISKYHTKFYHWYLVTGTPDRVALRPKTIELLLRAVGFFGEC